MTAIEKAIAALEKCLNRYHKSIKGELSLDTIVSDYKGHIRLEPFFDLKVIDLISELRAAQGEKVDELEEAIAWAEVEGWISYGIDGGEEIKNKAVIKYHEAILQAAKLQLERQRG